MLVLVNQFLRPTRIGIITGLGAVPGTFNVTTFPDRLAEPGQPNTTTFQNVPLVTPDSPPCPERVWAEPYRANWLHEGRKAKAYRVDDGPTELPSSPPDWLISLFGTNADLPDVTFRPADGGAAASVLAPGGRVLGLIRREGTILRLMWNHKGAACGHRLDLDVIGDPEESLRKWIASLVAGEAPKFPAPPVAMPTEEPPPPAAPKRRGRKAGNIKEPAKPARIE